MQSNRLWFLPLHFVFFVRGDSEDVDGGGGGAPHLWREGNVPEGPPPLVPAPPPKSVQNQRYRVLRDAV